MPVSKIHIRRHGCYGYIIAVVPHVPGTGWNLYNKEGDVQETFYGSPRTIKRGAKMYIDNHPDDFKENA